MTGEQSMRSFQPFNEFIGKHIEYKTNLTGTLTLSAK
nr:MAG TPA: hypothetical protein [Caudoviricetes sp.]